MRLGLLGGSFNPVHNGHLAIARQTREALGLDQILFIPTSHPPHKPNGSLAPAQDRYEMVRLAIASDPSLAISDVEIRRPGKSYSIDTIRLLQQEYGAQTQLFFLIGLDAFLDFPSWREPLTLLELCPFVVLSRPGLSFRSLSTVALLPPIPYPSLADLDAGRISRTRSAARKATPDLSQTTALRGLRIGHSLSNPPRAPGGKSVAALSGILYTSTSSLPRGARSHEQLGLRPSPLLGSCSIRRPPMLSSSRLRR